VSPGSLSTADAVVDFTPRETPRPGRIASSVERAGNGPSDADHAVVVRLELKTLKLGMSPRIGEQDLEHAQALAHVLDKCPPVLVESGSNIVVDGVHRILAARMMGRTEIAARYFVGSHQEALVEAVRANISHGKPLTLNERTSAARRILQMVAEWSDRRIAEACGLSAKTIAKLRSEAGERATTRIGRDGRCRPVDPVLVRERIAARLREAPDARATDIARDLLTSPSTVRDVRRRLVEGDHRSSSSSALNGCSELRQRLASVPTAPLGQDQAIQTMSGGKDFGCWLDRSQIEAAHWERFIPEIPLSRLPELIDLATKREAEWRKFAAALEARIRERTTKLATLG
jgi:ParB-like chromosome segregation protein Spo0J